MGYKVNRMVGKSISSLTDDGVGGVPWYHRHIPVVGAVWKGCIEKMYVYVLEGLRENGLMYVEDYTIVVNTSCVKDSDTWGRLEITTPVSDC